MADQGPIDVNALIAQIEAEGASKSDSSKPDPKVNLPAGLHLDPTGGVINIFGLDSRKININIYLCCAFNYFVDTSVSSSGQEKS